MTLKSWLSSGLLGLLFLGACQSKTPSVSDSKRERPSQMPDTTGLEVATLAGGCFWKMDAAYQQLKGVAFVEVGYAGGHVANPTYTQVCTRTTGHAESIRLWFDPKIVSFKEILEVFWNIHDPTILNREGNDVGDDYRSAVFYHSEAQRQTAVAVKDSFDKSGLWPTPSVTAIEPFKNYYPAEDYHQDYYYKHPDEPYTYGVVRKKVVLFETLFKDKLKNRP